MKFKTLESLLAFLDEIIDCCDEVHVVDKSDPDKVTEHVFKNNHNPELKHDDIPFADEEDIARCNPDKCNLCEYMDECFEFDESEEYEFEFDEWSIPGIDHVVFSGPATIIFWTDRTKTVVKCMEGEKFERYAGFAAACMKKMFGSTSRAKAIMEQATVEQESHKQKKQDKGVYVPDLTSALNEVIANHESVQEAINETFTKG